MTKKWTYEACFKEAQKYKTRKEFQANSNGAYQIAHKNGWFDDYTWMEPSKNEKKWDKESCYNEAKKYKSRGDFHKGSAGAYKVARVNGWLDDYDWFAPSSSAKKWDQETCFNEAQKYKLKIDFRENSVGAYNAACKNGWINNYTWLKDVKKPNGYWSKENCYTEAKKYESIDEFSKKNFSAYAIASKNGWLGDYTWLSRAKKRNGYWNKETCYVEARKYNTKGEFAKGCKQAYRVARTNGWLDDYIWFEAPENKWNKHSCYNEAKKYKTRAEFRNGNQSAYNVAYKNGWINDYDWLEQQFIWTREKCYEEAQKYKSRGQLSINCFGAYTAALKHGWLDDYTWFVQRPISDKPIYIVYCYKDEETNAAYVGLTNNMKRRHKQHCNGFLKHGERKYDIVYRYFHSIDKKPPLPTVLKEGLLADDAVFYEGYYAEFFKEMGVNLLNIAKTGSLGAWSKWTEEKCREEALKYKTRVEFARGSKGAYERARQNGWLKNYAWFSERRSWDRENCYNEAKKYKTKKEFQLKGGGAYNAARQNGWLKDYTWFEEVYKPSGYWNDYNTCFDAAKKCKTRSEFKKKYDSAYKNAMKNGWINDYAWFKQGTKKANE